MGVVIDEIVVAASVLSKLPTYAAVTREADSLANGAPGIYSAADAASEDADVQLLRRAAVLEASSPWEELHDEEEEGRAKSLTLVECYRDVVDMLPRRKDLMKVLDKDTRDHSLALLRLEECGRSLKKIWLRRTEDGAGARIDGASLASTINSVSMAERTRAQLQENRQKIRQRRAKDMAVIVQSLAMTRKDLQLEYSSSNTEGDRVTGYVAAELERQDERHDARDVALRAELEKVQEDLATLKKKHRDAEFRARTDRDRAERAMLAARSEYDEALTGVHSTVAALRTELLSDEPTLQAFSTYYRKVDAELARVRLETEAYDRMKADADARDAGRRLEAVTCIQRCYNRHLASKAKAVAAEAAAKKKARIAAAKAAKKK